jgi:ABC-type uncharacterized transport system permease subunit
MICGLFAGLAGALQVVGVYHRLIPAISSGYGFMGLMIGMLISYQAIWVAPIALFFAALNIGGIQLPIVMKLDSSLTGVLTRQPGAVHLADARRQTACFRKEDRRLYVQVILFFWV